MNSLFCMSAVTCVRCGASLPLSAADIVGTGYRCTPCTMKVQIADANEGTVDVGDDLPPALRGTLAKKARRRMFGGLALLGVLLAPLAIAAVTGSLGVLLVGGLGVYYSGLAGEMIVNGYRESRRFGARALPTATARLLPAATSGDGSASDR